MKNKTGFTAAMKVAMLFVSSICLQTVKTMQIEAMLT